mmetsp:Transcript_27001/g.68656  ORF Transcript_27001/g.68656 Transcript_27001/m.68656 type:complete len:235 (+) Transcript_27001:3-707(+)
MHGLLLCPPTAGGTLFAAGRLVSMVNTGAKWKQGLRLLDPHGGRSTSWEALHAAGITAETIAAQMADNTLADDMGEARTLHLPEALREALETVAPFQPPLLEYCEELPPWCHAAHDQPDSMGDGIVSTPAADRDSATEEQEATEAAAAAAAAAGAAGCAPPSRRDSGEEARARLAHPSAERSEMTGAFQLPLLAPPPVVSHSTPRKLPSPGGVASVGAEKRNRLVDREAEIHVD